MKQRDDGVAVTSAGSYENHLHFTSDRYHTSTNHITQFYRLDALPATQPTVPKQYLIDIIVDRGGGPEECE